MRRDIEERGWALATRLFSLTGRLVSSAGNDHQAFMALRQECRDTKAAFAESNHRLLDHRQEHGC